MRRILPGFGLFSASSFGLRRRPVAGTAECAWMRGLVLIAALWIIGDAAAAQSPAQKELNALTGAPKATRCFKSIGRAQELATRYVVSGICPQLRPMDPGQFLQALETQRAIDRDFTTDACQVQFSLMLRAGREWAKEDPPARCAATVRKLQKLERTDIFRGLVR
jgi:hypothetical protein